MIREYMVGRDFSPLCVWWGGSSGKSGEKQCPGLPFTHQQHHHQSDFACTMYMWHSKTHSGEKSNKWNQCDYAWCTEICGETTPLRFLLYTNIMPSSTICIDHGKDLVTSFHSKAKGIQFDSFEHCWNVSYIYCTCCISTYIVLVKTDELICSNESGSKILIRMILTGLRMLIKIGFAFHQNHYFHQNQDFHQNQNEK